MLGNLFLFLGHVHTQGCLAVEHSGAGEMYGQRGLEGDSQES